MVFGHFCQLQQKVCKIQYVSLSRPLFLSLSLSLSLLPPVRVVAASFWGDMQTGYYRGIVDNIRLTKVGPPCIPLSAAGALPRLVIPPLRGRGRDEKRNEAAALRGLMLLRYVRDTSVTAHA